MTLPEPQFDDLYREVILDHYRRPRNRGSLAEATRTAEGVNPVCGDEITLELLINDHMIEGVAFSGQGCAISLASASMLTERIKGKTTTEAIRVLGEVRAMLVNGEAPSLDLGDLEALEGVARLPVRVKCALLCWNVLQQGLNTPPNGA